MIRDQLTDALRDALVAVGVAPPATIGLERPGRPEHGDWSSNVAMATAKGAGRNPRELAQEVADHLNAALPEHVDKVEIAGPGFVNFRLRPTWLHDVVREVIAAGDDRYGRSTLGADQRVNVEFVSANPTGPLHAGHARGAVFGDSLARILGWAGHDVSREFYINDRGLQMANFAASIAARAAGEQPPEDGYQGDYVADWAEGLGESDPLEHGYARALSDQREVLSQLGVIFDTWFSERSMVASGAIDQTLADLRERGVAYDEDGAVWLRSTDYGDDKDRVLVRSNGEFTYLLPDIAYHRDKFGRGYDRLIDVWGADHHGYVLRMKAAVAASGHSPDDVEPVITQLVKLMRDGQPVRLSKRTGDIIELRDLLTEVGPDVVRLTYLLQSVDSPQTVDLDVIVQQSMDNPVFYVQMAHARVCSIAKVAAERGLTRRELDEVDLASLTHERELEVMRSLHALPEVVELAARERAPHKVTNWVRDLASSVHGFYHDCPILRDDVDDDLRQARWWLAESAAIGLRVGLALPGRDGTDVDVSALPLNLLPDTAGVAPDGHLHVGGVDVLDLAAEFGTPLFVYDEAHLRARCREAVTAFPAGVAFVSKAFLCTAMARLVDEEGMSIDVATGGELHVALAAGVDPSRIVLHGNNKSTDELRTALRERIGRIVVDSFDELDRLDALVAEGLPVPAILIRVTPGVDAHTHEFVMTGQEDSKFGFGWHSGAATAAVERARSSGAVDLVGLHMHIGSQVFVAENFAHAVETVAELAREVALPELCVGGGLGVAYVAGEVAPTLTEWADAIHEVATAVGIDARITAEPGRSIAAEAGMTLYTVGTIKEIPGVRTYVSVDGGMSDNPRPVLYGSGYETFLPRATDADRSRTIRLVGKHCESGDLLVRKGKVPDDLVIGDVLCTPVTGAYGHSMGSNYNKVPRPAVVFVADGAARLVVRRETYDDLLRLDVGA